MTDRVAPYGATTMDRVRQWANVGALLLTLIVNSLANVLPIGGRTTAQVSDSFPVYFVPAGYVFAIWGVIYLGLIVYTVYQARPSQAADPLQRRIGWLFAATCVLNSGWIFLWQYELLPLTLPVMAGLLALLIVIYVRLDPVRTRPSAAVLWAILVPFSIYLAWITVATVANTTDLLYWLGWHEIGRIGRIAAALLLVVAAGITTLAAVPRRDLAYICVIVWAFAGIAVKQWAFTWVAAPALVLAALVVLAWLAGPWLTRSGGLPLRPKAA